MYKGGEICMNWLLDMHSANPSVLIGNPSPVLRYYKKIY